MHQSQKAPKAQMLILDLAVQVVSAQSVKAIERIVAVLPVREENTVAGFP